MDFLDTRLPMRFWNKIAVNEVSGCWSWTAAVTGGHGYPQYRESGKRGTTRVRRAYRVTFEIMHGPVPPGLELDHLCRNRRCVNPSHLEAVTHNENTRRAGLNIGAVNRAKTTCAKGHPLDAENTYLRPTGGRACLTCRRARSASWNKSKSKRKRRS